MRLLACLLCLGGLVLSGCATVWSLKDDCTYYRRNNGCQKLSEVCLGQRSVHIDGESRVTNEVEARVVACDTLAKYLETDEEALPLMVQGCELSAANPGAWHAGQRGAGMCMEAAHRTAFGIRTPRDPERAARLIKLGCTLPASHWWGTAPCGLLEQANGHMSPALYSFFRQSNQVSPDTRAFETRMLQHREDREAAERESNDQSDTDGAGPGGGSRGSTGPGGRPGKSSAPGTGGGAGAGSGAWTGAGSGASPLSDPPGPGAGVTAGESTGVGSGASQLPSSPGSGSRPGTGSGGAAGTGTSTPQIQLSTSGSSSKPGPVSPAAPVSPPQHASPPAKTDPRCRPGCQTCICCGNKCGCYDNAKVIPAC